MRPLRYSINVTLDGCVDHRVGSPDPELHQHSAGIIARADALILGRPTYELMESAWRPPREETGFPDWTVPFAQAIGKAKKYVASRTLTSVDWNAELISGDLIETVRCLKEEPGEGLYVGGVVLPVALADAGLIDEFEFIVHPRIAGHGPWLFDGLRQVVDLEPVRSITFAGGAVATTYVPKGS